MDDILAHGLSLFDSLWENILYRPQEKLKYFFPGICPLLKNVLMAGARKTDMMCKGDSVILRWGTGGQVVKKISGASGHD
jgi:hypothetical protein